MDLDDRLIAVGTAPVVTELTIASVTLRSFDIPGASGRLVSNRRAVVATREQGQRARCYPEGLR